MTRYVVGVDVETTSLDPTTGDIIDVAAIKYDLKTNEEVGRFSCLCKPKGVLTPETTAITGITSEMVMDKLPFSEIREKLKKFIGNSVVFAHNAPFDIGYLSYHGLELENLVWDTFPLASVAWPEAESYNLGLLAHQLNISLNEEHRAAADVVTTWHLLRHILQQLEVTKGQQQQISRILEKGKLGHYIDLFSINKTIASNPGPIQQKEESNNAIIDQPSSYLLSEEGPLIKGLQGFVPRPEQQSMAAAIDEWLGQGKYGLIEAGTGTGKTYAYLVPMLKFSSLCPVVIATYTRHLQDQLTQTDLPRLMAALGVKRKVATLKGRQHYLCLTRFRRYLEKPQFEPSEAILLIKLLLWSIRQPGVDLERLNISHQAEHVIPYISADGLTCRTGCNRSSDCAYQKAKLQATEADILVVNHALLIQGLLGEDNQIQGAYVVIDEAHHLEEVARQAAARNFTPERVAQLLAPLLQISQKEKSSLANHIYVELTALLQQYRDLLQIATNYHSRVGVYDRLLLNSGLRKQREWQKVFKAASLWLSKLSFLGGLSQSLISQVSEESRKTLEEADKQINSFRKEFESFVVGDDARIQWLERENISDTEKSETSFHDTALSVQKLISPLFTQSKGIILTSATLTINGSFAYIKQRLGLSEAEELRLPSSFAYDQNMLVYLLADSPKPSLPGFEEYAADVVGDVAELLQGRTLGLFTAQQMVRGVYYRLIKRLNKGTIRLLAQKMTGGRHALLHRFRNLPESVLLGTLSFWEGVDVPGDSLSAVVIAKLPFSSPDDPIINAVALAERINPFTDISLPQAVLKLQQGVGRLLRSHSDRGVIVVIDSRFHRYEYGEVVLKSLPPATIRSGSRSQLIPNLQQWFGLDLLEKWQSNSEK